MSFYYTARLFWVGAYNIAWVGVMTTVASCLRGGSQVMTDCSGAGAVEAYFSVFAYFFEFLILIMLLRALDRTQRQACRLLAAWAGLSTVLIIVPAVKMPAESSLARAIGGVGLFSGLGLAYYSLKKTWEVVATPTRT